MDRYKVPLNPRTQHSKPSRRHRWKRSLVELEGRVRSKYRHEASGLLIQSYSEIGSFAHSYRIGGARCRTHMERIANGTFWDNQSRMKRQGISALEFDTKGTYLASVTKSGCLTVHEFEALYCQSTELTSCLKEDESKHLLHLSTDQQLDAVRWNPVNQNEIACTSMKSDEVLIFDVSYISSEPVDVLRKRHTVTVNGCELRKGLSDMVFTSEDDSRLLASDVYGVVSVWDRRASDLPCLELTTNSGVPLNSVQLNAENQIVLGTGKLGIIYMWDLRGGTTSAFQSHKGVQHHPFASIRIASLVEKIGSLKAQSDIVSKEVHTISLDPSCPYQMAFHLDDGWSGVLDIQSLQVTHLHCPPPAWLNGSNMSTDVSYLRKPSWLLRYSIYAVPSASGNGIHLLDFYPDTSSPCHVDYSEDVQRTAEANSWVKKNRFLSLSEEVTSCAAHPLNSTIIAGTKQSSLLLVSQRQQSCEDDEDIKQ